MLELKPVSFYDVQHWFVDFQKKSRCFEMPLETSQYVGAFLNDKLVGYFILQGYDNTDVEINQGYLSKEYRHSTLSDEFMKLLEEMCKKAGYKKMLLGTHNRFMSYIKFAKRLKYTPEHLTFCKLLGD